MKTLGLIMAGGQGERMRASGVQCPKPLVPIRGVPLLERNLCALLGAGLRQIVVSVPAVIPEIRGFTLSRGRALVEAIGGKISLLEEERPLGNIGCAGRLREAADTVLVVYADNLTAINLRALLDEHHKSGAALTLATHYEPFKMPFGEVRVVDKDIVEYVEKPQYQFLVCSAVSALGPEALNALPLERPTGLSNLAQMLISSGKKVRAFSHTSPWVDVNDATASERAERIVAANLQEFECWAQQPDAIVVGVLWQAPTGILLGKHHASDEGDEGAWEIPSRELALSDGSVEATARELTKELGCSPESLRSLTVFDEVDPRSRRILRYHIFSQTLGFDAQAPRLSHSHRWLKLDEAANQSNVSSIVPRAIAALKGSTSLN